MKLILKNKRNKQIHYGLLSVTIFILLTLFLPVTQADTTSLPTRGNPGMAYDSESDKVVIFGGWNATTTPYSSTWIFDYNSDKYTEKKPSPAPIRRAEAGVVYDSQRDMIVIFGGRESFTDTGDFNDSWTYDCNTDTWTELFPVIAPSPRRAVGMAYDSESDRIILFGGQSGVSVEVFFNETWVGIPGSNTWQKMSPVLAPPARFSHSMAYDNESDRVILFGGYSGSSFFSDTWAYDYNTNSWEELINTTHPSARGAPAMVYDSESDRIVLFGGAGTSPTFDDTWVYDYNSNSWTQQNPPESPPARSRHGGAYDSQSDRFIIYGGTTGGFNSAFHINDGKTWAYDLNTDTWEERDLGSTPPPPDWTLVIVIVVVVVVIGSVSVIVIFIRKRGGK
ncbi:MAG: Kelch repeat-containing protein [Candidatus Hermodarchaeota archaeon]